MPTTYSPRASDALYDTFTGVDFDDRPVYSSHNRVKVTSKFFLKPIQDEVLNLIKMSLASGQAIQVRNETGAQINKGQLVYPSGVNQVQEAGDTGGQLASWIIRGATEFNTNNGKIYWELTDTGGTRSVKGYKHADKNTGDEVVSGTRVGDGAITLSEVNSSGIAGSVTVTYTADDTDAANILTVNRRLITKARADDPATAAYWVLDADLANNTDGLAYAVRTVTGIDTSAAAAVGDKVYLDASTAGDFTFTEPTGANLSEEVGIVLADDATDGAIFFYPWHGLKRKKLTAESIPYTHTTGALTEDNNNFNWNVSQKAMVVGAPDGVIEASTNKLQIAEEGTATIFRSYNYDSTGTNGNHWYARRARGTKASKTATQDNDRCLMLFGS